jgi:hypothetical protein
MLSALSSVFVASGVMLYKTGVHTEAETTDERTMVARTGRRGRALDCLSGAAIHRHLWGTGHLGSSAATSPPSHGKNKGPGPVRGLCVFGELELGAEFKMQGQTTL